jgi:hypothetical protein
VAVRDELAEVVVTKTLTLLVEHPMHLDYPVSGMAFAALSLWLLRSAEPEREAQGIELLALADRFSYSRTLPVMAWSPLATAADTADPGRLTALLEEYDGRPGRELTGEVADLLGQVQEAVRSSS